MIVNYHQKEFKETISGPHSYVVFNHKIINFTSEFCLENTMEIFQ